MEIKGASIILEKKGDKELERKGYLALNTSDKIMSCHIVGGKIYNNDTNNDLPVFSDCYIVNCEYSIEHVVHQAPSCPIITNCIIRDCRLPYAFFVHCLFKYDKDKGVERSIYSLFNDKKAEGKVEDK